MSADAVHERGGSVGNTQKTWMSAGKAEVDERGQSIGSTRGELTNVTKWRQHTENVKMSVDRMGAALS